MLCFATVIHAMAVQLRSEPIARSERLFLCQRTYNLNRQGWATEIREVKGLAQVTQQVSDRDGNRTQGSTPGFCPLLHPLDT